MWQCISIFNWHFLNLIVQSFADMANDWSHLQTRRWGSGWTGQVQVSPAYLFLVFSHRRCHWCSSHVSGGSKTKLRVCWVDQMTSIWDIYVLNPLFNLTTEFNNYGNASFKAYKGDFSSLWHLVERENSMHLSFHSQ